MMEDRRQSYRRESDKPKANGICGAYGCPMLGVYSDSTTGSDNWYCLLHFRRPFSQWQQITAIVHKESWLAFSIKDLRMNYAREEWANVYRQVNRNMKEVGREDLAKQKDESVWKWVGRLEGVMYGLTVKDGSCASEVVRKVAIASGLESLRKVRFNLDKGEDDE